MYQSGRDENSQFSLYAAAIHLMVFLVYSAVYLFAFNMIESREASVHIIGLPIDNRIPFLEIFIVPYLLWFLYMAYFICYFLRKDLTEYYRMISFLAAGMTVFILISIVFPNGLMLRPIISRVNRDNIFMDLVSRLYYTDTATNVFPSIHVYNTVGIMLSVIYAKRSCYVSRVHIFAAHLLGTLIVLSTMFLKQHSVVDVIGAFILSYIVYKCFYSEAYTAALHRLGLAGVPGSSEKNAQRSGE